MASYTKQPSEVIPLGFDFGVGNNLANGETISVGSSQVIITDLATGETVSDMLVAGSIAVIGSILQAIFQGGVNGKKYKVEFVAWISATKQLEEDLILTVRD